MSRMVVPYDHTVLRDRLVVWRGPLPFQLAKEPKALVQLADSVAASDVVLDSLKDVQAELLDMDILTGTSADPNVVRILAPFVIGSEHVAQLSAALAKIAP